MTTERTRAIRRVITSILMQPHEVPALWEREPGGAPVNGWVSTDAVAQVATRMVSGSRHRDVYPQLRALARRGEIQHWPAHRTRPKTDRAPSAEEAKRYGDSHKAHWRIVPKAAPIHDPVLLMEWLAS